MRAWEVDVSPFGQGSLVCSGQAWSGPGSSGALVAAGYHLRRRRLCLRTICWASGAAGGIRSGGEFRAAAVRPFVGAGLAVFPWAFSARLGGWTRGRRRHGCVALKPNMEHDERLS